LELPIVKDTALDGDKGVTLVNGIILKMGHLFRAIEKHDYGIDGEIELVVSGSKNNHASGRLIAAQIKCGPSFLKKIENGSFIHYCTKVHANYWLDHSLPVIIILCDPTASECYWVQVSETSLSWTKKGRAKILVPKANCLSKSASDFENIANSKVLQQGKKTEIMYEIPLNDTCAISLDDEDLAVLCAEISRAFTREGNISIAVSFENEVAVIKELEILNLTANPTVEQRKRVLELEDMHDWFSAKRGHLERGLRMLLKEKFIRLAGIENCDPPNGSLAVRAFVEYYIFHRMGSNRPSATSLDIFPDQTRYPGLVAKVFLNGKEKKAFAQRHNLGEDPTPLKWSSYYFIDLDHDLRLKRGLPAVVTELLFFLDRNNIEEGTFFSETDGLLYDWRLGLS